MDRNPQRTINLYDRVMPRVYSKSRSSLKSNPNITRHVTSSVPLGGKASVSNLSSGVFSELPTVLSDYVQEKDVKLEKAIHIKRPKKTLQSLDIKKTSHQLKNFTNSRKIHAQASAPAILNLEKVDLAVGHIKECYSNQSHAKLKELKVNDMYSYYFI